MTRRTTKSEKLHEMTMKMALRTNVRVLSGSLFCVGLLLPASVMAQAATTAKAVTKAEAPAKEAKAEAPTEETKKAEPEAQPSEDTEEEFHGAASEEEAVAGTAATTATAEEAPTDAESVDEAEEAESVDEAEEAESVDEAEEVEEKAEDEPKEKKAKPEPEEKIDYTSLPLGHHQKRFDIGVGVRLGWVPDESYDYFGEDDMVPAFSIRLGGTPWASGPLSLAIVGEYAVAGDSSVVRDTPTQINLHTFGAGVEFRYHPMERFYGYGRLLAGVTYMNSRLGSETSTTRMTMDTFEFTGALTVGAAARIFGSRDGRNRTIRGHLYLEGGYGFTPETSLVYTMEEGPERPEDVDLGTLSLSGPQMGFGLILSY